MWRKDEVKQQSAPQPAAPANTSFPQGSTASAPAPTSSPAPNAPVSALPVSPRAAACISQGIRIKGEITGKEDLFVDGTVEGKLDFGNASVTVGPNGKVKADISAREGDRARAGGWKNRGHGKSPVVEFGTRDRRSSNGAPGD